MLPKWLPQRVGWGVFAGFVVYVTDEVEVARWLPAAFCALLVRFLWRFGGGGAAIATCASQGKAQD